MKIAISNKFYDILKFVALYVLPGLATLYFGLAAIWRLPYPEQVVGTILALDAFLGALLGLSNSQYKALKTKKTKAKQASFIKPVEFGYAPQLTGKLYDILYWTAQVVLPAIGTLYFALSRIWGLPYGEQIVGTIALIDSFLGLFLGINTTQYKKYNQLN
jgi:hypothetical protein